ncbi:ABC transporter ATP-binding protein [Paenibacillus elgii]|uniref:ABC transporter ATP-binding protein n=1 Tax=Paenibacillus elgii TaxID=189691 RepID=UPI0020401D61|nr:ABC transporter ATP-binding protein [Paenibacillus elgii]MCM3272468.1 ABC transporter ATP-binding protein [Paenibacillus elgii]
MTASAIHTDHLEFHVGAFRLRDVTVSIPKGKLTAIVGPNGSGKSTLLKIIAQLLKADHGEVYVHNRQAKTYKSIEFAQTVAMLTQSKGQLPELTVRELVAYGRSPYKRMFDRMTADDERIIDWALDITGTAKAEQQMFHTLSGGEQQKVRIAMALAQKTNILLLDEPTTYLDLAHQLDVMEMLQRINETYRLTIVMVLHDLQQAANYCDYLIAMKHGRVVGSGNPKEMISPQFLQDVYAIEAKVAFDDDYPVIIPIRKTCKPKEEIIWSL